MVRRPLGFSVLELLVAIALTAILLVAIAASSLAFMRTARDTEVHSSLQRDLVFSVEAVESALKVAVRWEPEPEDANWEDSDREYRIYHMDSSTLLESLDPILVRLEGTELRVGSRLVSRNIASLDLLPGAEQRTAQLSITTVRPLVGLGAQTYPLSLVVDVVMRNAPRYVTVRNLQALRSSNKRSVAISWDTLPYRTSGSIAYRQEGASTWIRLEVAPAIYHEHTLSGLQQTRDYEFFLDLTDDSGAIVPPETGEF